MGSLVAHLSGTSAPDARRVQEMVAAAPHRGTRLVTTGVGRCVLGTGAHGDWDDTSLAERDGYAAVVVGRIDNLAELASEVGLNDERPAQGQASLIIDAFRVFGRELPKRLRGAFAVALTDGESLVCFRDHLGFGPLFHRREGEDVFVASEAKQVIAGSGLAAAPDLDVVERIFYESPDDETSCALRGVSRLPAATLMTAGTGGSTTVRYWHPERLLETAQPSASEVQSQFQTLMTRAVERVLTGADVVTLSGGIDSPAVAAFAAPAHRRLTGGPIHALSAEFPDFPSVDERRYVELIGERLDIPVHFYRPKARPLDDLERWVRLADGPFPTTSLAEAREQYELARDLGLRNILTGEFAEFVIDLRSNLVPHLIGRGRLAAAARHVIAQRARGAGVGALLRQVAAAITPSTIATMYGRLHRRRPPLPDWIDPPPWSRVYRRAPAPRARWRQTQLNVFVGAGFSLEAEEVVQALSGVRVRRPWADVDLWEFFLGLPAETRYPDPGSKTLVRRLLAGRVPDEILRRKSKTVFDESVRAKIDYGVLHRLLSAPGYRLKGVDYPKLAGHLEREDLDLRGFIWARDLAAVHAFLRQW
jgi:asparagine synthase (glutamine-hydrolysing)